MCCGAWKTGESQSVRCTSPVKLRLPDGVFSSDGASAACCILPTCRSARGQGKARVDQDGSVWQRVVLPAVVGIQESTPQFGWALQLHVDGAIYLSPTTDERLHTSLPENSFIDAHIEVDPNTGEHVIQQLDNSQHVDAQYQLEIQQHETAAGWGWPAPGYLPMDEEYAGFGEFPWTWGPQIQYLDAENDVATTECTPALCMMWWMLGLRHGLHLVSSGSHGCKRSLLVASAAGGAQKKRQREPPAG